MNSTNMTIFTNSSSATYVFNPVHNSIKLSIACPTVIAGVYAFLANSLILYFMQKKSAIPQNGSYRRALTDRFIQSLALSDVLCTVISLPVYASEFFFDFIKTDLHCKISRYIAFFFPLVTIMNYLFIGVERYLGVYHPLRIPSERVGKRFVVVAWFLGASVVLIALPSYYFVRYDLDNNMYTMVCKYDNSVKMYRTFFLTFTLVAYIIPSTILTITSIKVLLYLRGQRSRILAGAAADSRSTCQLSRYKLTNMFVSLIFAFIIPYMLFVAYGGAVMILKLKVTFTVDYITRMIGGSFVYANGAIGSSILLYNSAYLRRNLISLFRQVFCQNDSSPAVSIAARRGGITLNNVARRDVPRATAVVVSETRNVNLTNSSS